MDSGSYFLLLLWTTHQIEYENWKLGESAVHERPEPEKKIPTQKQTWHNII